MYIKFHIHNYIIVLPIKINLKLHHINNTLNKFIFKLNQDYHPFRYFFLLIIYIIINNNQINPMIDFLNIILINSTSYNSKIILNNYCLSL